jgi:hypothetical protein
MNRRRPIGDLNRRTTETAARDVALRCGRDGV